MTAPIRTRRRTLAAATALASVAVAVAPAPASAFSFRWWKPRPTATPVPAATATPTPAATASPAPTATATPKPTAAPAAPATPAPATPAPVTIADATAVVDAATDTAGGLTAAATQTAAETVQAATTAPSGTSSAPVTCPTQAVSKAYAMVGDDADYMLAPGGDFESGTAGWTLSGGAKVVSGNENLGARGGSKSLRLPPLAVAVSPEFCVDSSHPSFRFATKPDSFLSGYVAAVLYRDAAGKLTQAQFTASADMSLFPAGTWTASNKAPLSINIPLLNNNPTARAQIMFVSTPMLGGLSFLTFGLSGVVSFDSLMVDPYRRG